jgi:hypothetical protein
MSAAMTTTLHVFHGVRVLACAADGPPLQDERGATDVIGDSFAHRPDWIAIPVSRLGEDFFRLRTRVAGGIVQKFVNYGLRLAIVGDVDHHVAQSTALRDFVRESNRGGHLWFVASLDELAARLGGAKE